MDRRHGDLGFPGLERGAARSADRRRQVLHEGGRGRRDAGGATPRRRSPSGSAPMSRGDSYLQIGELVGDLALVYDWCFDQVTGASAPRWLKYANQAVWNVWHHTQAKWGNATIPWSGWSVNNPSNNYYYSFLRAHDAARPRDERRESPEADDVDHAVPRRRRSWRSSSRRSRPTSPAAARARAPATASRCDGCSSSTTSGRRRPASTLAVETGHTRASMLSFMHQTLPTLDRVAPTGDQSRDSTASFFDYHRNYLQELIAHLPDRHARRAREDAARRLERDRRWGAAFMVAYDFIYDNADVTRAARRPGTDVLRDAASASSTRAPVGTRHATWVNMIAGPYTESHAHQDQGSIMIYKGGWLAYDPVIHSNRASTRRRPRTRSCGSIRAARRCARLRPRRRICSRSTAVTAGSHRPRI